MKPHHFRPSVGSVPTRHATRPAATRFYARYVCVLPVQAEECKLHPLRARARARQRGGPDLGTTTLRGGLMNFARIARRICAAAEEKETKRKDS